MRTTFASIIFIILTLAVSPVFSQAPRWHLEQYPQGPVIVPGFQAPLDSLAVADPEIYWDGDWFRLYYTGTGDDNINRILLAGSRDLLTWYPGGVVLAPTPGTFNEDSVGDAEIIVDSDVFTLYYTATRSGWSQIARIDSSHGYSFQGPGDIVLSASYRANSFDAIGVGEPSVVISDGIHQMMYRGYDGTNWYRLGVALSEDGHLFNRVINPDDFGANFGLGPHGFDDGGATEPEIWLGNDNGVRLLYTSLHY